MGNEGSKVEWQVTTNGPEKQGTEGPALSTIEGCSGAFANDSFYVFGGGNVDSTSSDLIRFSPASGTHSVLQLPKESVPRARTGANLVYVPSKNALLLFGGMAEGVWLNDAHLFNLASNTWEQVSSDGAAPAPRDKATLVYLDDDRVVLFGGFGPQPPIDDDDEESAAEDDAAADNKDQTEDAADNFDDLGDDDDESGDDEDRGPSMTFQWFSDVWCLNLGTGKWEQIQAKGLLPEGRAAATACLLKTPTGATGLYIFGGRDPSGRTNELLELNTADWSWSTSADAPAGQAPSKRSFHSAVAVSEHRMVVWGGRDAEENDLNDIHVFDSSVNCWVQPTVQLSDAAPSGRGFTASAYSAPHLLIFGGSGQHKNTEPTFFSDLLSINLQPIIDGPPIVKPEPEPATDFAK